MASPLQKVSVLAPAKLNLSLDVVGTLPGGYHALDMVMQAVSLYEQVTLRRSADLVVRLPGSRVPPGPKNTAYKAALAFFHYTGLLAGVDITIHKTVPVRAGMGGGSADAAAVLVGLNALYGARLSMTELCALGASVGADVPFALMGGTCRVQGLGDLIKALPPCPDCAAQEAAIRAEDLSGLCAAAGNALEVCAGGADTAALKQALLDQGAKAALMTGSGAAVFGIFEAEEPARRAAEALAAAGRQIFTLRPDRGGARIVKAIR